MLDTNKDVATTVATTSRKIAAAFGKPHSAVLDAIQNLDCPETFLREHFIRKEFSNAQGRVYYEFDVTAAGAMLVVMGFRGAKAVPVKLKFIEAFNAMEAAVAARSGRVDWATAQLQSAGVASALTDTLQDFVAYAKAQGSENAERYYGSITLMEYKALSLIEKGAKVGKSFRDTLDGMQIATLTVAENVARKAMQRGMAQGLHYKEIYQVAKMDVERLADVVNFTNQLESA